MPFSTDRVLNLDAPLGPDAALTAFAGREELSRPFRFALDFVTETAVIAPADQVGKPVGWSVVTPDDSTRYFHGYVSKLSAGQLVGRGRHAYRAEVVPWLWFLTRTTDCKIFQNKSVPDIVTAVFDAFGFSAYDKSKLQGTYNPREYVVQYRETAFAFVSRLMEEVGIYYYFTFEQGKHTLVMADAAAGYYDCDPHGTVVYRPDLGGVAVAAAVTTWDRVFAFGSGTAAHTDYNFTKPTTNLLKSTDTTVSLTDVSKFKLFDYPGRYQEAADGDSLAKVRIEEVEAGYDTASGSGRCSSFAAGGMFTLTGHSDASDQKYVLTAVEHAGSEDALVVGAGGSAGDYSNTFACVPASVPFRPARTTPRPVVSGLQPAVVVGPSGEEIYTDQYGRIKVQFFWDRYGKKDADSSCWMRVAELWAGQQWGMVFTPRIGQEVLVEFLEGDPDQPVVTGRVYNADQMPPYALPDNATQSGVKTRSTKGGGADDYNELRFEDKKDNEQVYFHAQKDFVRVVEHDDTLTVGNDQSIEVKNNRTLVVKEGYEKITIEKGDRERTVSKGDDSLTVSTGKRTVQVKADYAVTVDQGNRTVTVSQGNDTHTVSQGNLEIDVSAGTALMKAAQSITLKVGSNTIVIDTSSITITVGGSTMKFTSSAIEMSSTQVKAEGSASITLQGTQAKLTGTSTVVNGDASAKVSGAMVEVAGSAMTKISGGVVMIN